MHEHSLDAGTQRPATGLDDAVAADTQCAGVTHRSAVRGDPDTAAAAGRLDRRAAAGRRGRRVFLVPRQLPARRRGARPRPSRSPRRIRPRSSTRICWSRRGSTTCSPGCPTPTSPRQEKALHDRIAQQIKNLPQVAAAWVIDANGRELVSARVYPVNRELDHSGREDFRALQDGGNPSFIWALRARSLDGGDLQPYFTVSRRRAGGRRTLPRHHRRRRIRRLFRLVLQLAARRLGSNTSPACCARTAPAWRAIRKPQRMPRPRQDDELLAKAIADKATGGIIAERLAVRRRRQRHRLQAAGRLSGLRRDRADPRLDPAANGSRSMVGYARDRHSRRRSASCC